MQKSLVAPDAPAFLRIFLHLSEMLRFDSYVTTWVSTALQIAYRSNEMIAPTQYIYTLNETRYGWRELHKTEYK